MGLETDVLEKIFRNISVAGQSVERSEYPVSISGQKNRKGLAVAFLRPGDKRKIWKGFIIGFG